MQRAVRPEPTEHGATELQSNGPKMQKTLENLGFCSGEDRTRTTYNFPEELALRTPARREIRRVPILSNQDSPPSIGTNSQVDLRTPMLAMLVMSRETHGMKQSWSLQLNYQNKN